jgi:hypothetical protein
MTLEEAGKFKNDSDYPKVQEFLSNATAREIQQFIHKYVTPQHNDQFFNLARVALDVRLSEDSDLIADKLSKQTDRLVRYTIGLYVFTVALAFFAVIQILIMIVDYCSKNH